MDHPSYDAMHAWGSAVQEWRRTGDVSALAEAAAAAAPRQRITLLQTIVPSGLRNDLLSILHRRAVCRPRGTD